MLDTAQDWAWWRRQLGRVLRAAGIGPGDRVALAHSFGPYVQFWASYEGAQEAGAIVIPLGGMDSVQRLETMREYGATALLCTPSYALHLARVVAEQGLEAALGSVERVVCTGEPGASLPAVRDRIEAAWGARCFDHAGASEVGSFAYPCAADGGMHLFEDDFVCEVLDPATGAPVAEGGAGELVMTALGADRLPGDPLPHRRHGRAVRDALLRGARRDVAPARHPWARGRHGGDPRDERVPVGDRGDPAPVARASGEFSITFYNDPHAMDEVKVEVELDPGARGARDPGAAAPDARAARPHRAGQAGDPAELHRQGAARPDLRPPARLGT